jgi:hypothetical protein
MINNILTHFINRSNSTTTTMQWMGGTKVTHSPLHYGEIVSAACNTINVRLAPNRKAENLVVSINWESTQGLTNLSIMSDPHRSDAIQILGDRGGRGYLQIEFMEAVGYNPSQKVVYPDLSGWNKDGT